MSSVASSFPPQVTLASALNASNPSVLAAKAFADPNSGYASGLRLATAVADNQAGHFNLASGITVASNALSEAFNTLKDFQSSLSDIYSTVSRLRDPALEDDARQQELVRFNQQIDALRDDLNKAAVDNFNLISALHSDGVKLDLQNGAFTNLGKTPSANENGDQRFAFSPDQITFRTPDLSAAIDSLSRAGIQSLPGVGDDNSLDTVNRFQDAIKEATGSLKAFQSDLADAAAQRLAVSDDDNNGAINASGAQQIASRLAQALHNDSFCVTASGGSQFFSLFA